MSKGIDLLIAQYQGVLGGLKLLHIGDEITTSRKMRLREVDSCQMTEGLQCQLLGLQPVPRWRAIERL